MDARNIHDTERLVRYAEGTLSFNERGAAEQHLGDCAACRDFVSFVQDFNSALVAAKPDGDGPDEPCPDSSLIIALDADELDDETARQIRAHLLFCRACLEEFFLLWRLGQEEGSAFVSWLPQFEKLKERILDLGVTYGVGTLLGPLRIAAEAPAFAMRGGPDAGEASKSVEVKVGENTYGLEFHASTDAVSCDIVGFQTMLQSPLEVTIFSESGAKVASTHTDKFGNVRISAPRNRSASGMWLLSLACGGAERQILFRVPEP
jgi:hypothetical protein